MNTARDTSSADGGEAMEMSRGDFISAGLMAAVAPGASFDFSPGYS